MPVLASLFKVGPRTRCTGAVPLNRCPSPLFFCVPGGAFYSQPWKRGRHYPGSPSYLAPRVRRLQLPPDYAEQRAFRQVPGPADWWAIGQALTSSDPLPPAHKCQSNNALFTPFPSTLLNHTQDCWIARQSLVQGLWLTTQVQFLEKWPRWHFRQNFDAVGYCSFQHILQLHWRSGQQSLVRF